MYCYALLNLFVCFHHAGTGSLNNLPTTRSDITFTTPSTTNSITSLPTGPVTTPTTSLATLTTIVAPSTSKSVTTESIAFLTTSLSTQSVSTMLDTAFVTTNPVTTLATESVTTKTINAVSIPTAKSDTPLATDPVAVFMTSTTMNTFSTIHTKPVTAFATTSPVTNVATSGTVTTYHLTTFSTSKTITTKTTRSNSSNGKNEKPISGSKHHKLIDDLRKKLDSAVNSVLEKGPDYFQVKENQIDSENISDEDQEVAQEETTSQCDLQQTQELLNVPFKLELTHVSTSDVDETHDGNSTMKGDFSKLPWSIVISKQASDFLKKKKTPKNVIRDIERTLYVIGQGY